MHNKNLDLRGMYSEVTQKITSKLPRYNKNLDDKHLNTFYIDGISLTLQMLERIISIKLDPHKQFIHEDIDTHFDMRRINSYHLNSAEDMFHLEIVANNVTLRSLSRWMTLLQQFSKHRQLIREITADIKQKTMTCEHYNQPLKEAVEILEDVIALRGRRNQGSLHFPREMYDLKTIESYVLNNKADLMAVSIFDKNTQTWSLPIQEYIDRIKRYNLYNDIDKDIKDSITRFNKDGCLTQIAWDLIDALQCLRTIIKTRNETNPRFSSNSNIITDDLTSREALLALKISIRASKYKQLSLKKSMSTSDIKTREIPRFPPSPFQNNEIITSHERPAHESRSPNLSLKSRPSAQNILAQLNTPQDFFSLAQNMPSTTTNDSTQVSLNSLLAQLKAPRTAKGLFNIIYEKMMPEIHKLQEEISERKEEAKQHINNSIDNLTNALFCLRNAISLKYDRPECPDFLKPYCFTTIQEMLYYKENDATMSLCEAIYAICSSVRTNHYYMEIVAKLCDFSTNIEELLKNPVVMHQDILSSIVKARSLCALAEIGDIDQIKDQQPTAADINLLINQPIKLTWHGLLKLLTQPTEIWLGHYNALMVAAIYNQIEIVKYFIKLGADITIKGGRDKDHSVLDCAHVSNQMRSGFGLFKPENNPTIDYLEEVFSNNGMLASKSAFS